MILASSADGVMIDPLETSAEHNRIHHRQKTEPPRQPARDRAMNRNAEVTIQAPSWGCNPAIDCRQRSAFWESDAIDCLEAASPANTTLATGLQRSYGDSSLLDTADGFLTRCSGLNRFLAFDPQTGILRAEAGATLGDIIAQFAPRGWFPPVVPGTQFVTLGGAVANDIHGKNHHCHGTFGCHVLRFALRRSDGRTLLCSADENPDWFAATIGGLGLTGFLLWVEIQLLAIPSQWLTCENQRFSHLDAFFDCSAEEDNQWQYTVAWIDATARGAKLGRGIHMAGSHSTSQRKAPHFARQPSLTVPGKLPALTHLRMPLAAFNQLYFHKPQRKSLSQPFNPFFFPLDKIGNWNHLHGPKGFFQYQCVLPDNEDGRKALATILEKSHAAREVSTLVVLKRFGTKPSPGWLSFPRPGLTLALDFPNRGTSTLEHLDELDTLVHDTGGRLYPAKDARMSPAFFKASYPEWQRLESYRDPAILSAFWKRVTLDPAS